MKTKPTIQSITESTPTILNFLIEIPEVVESNHANGIRCIRVNGKSIPHHYPTPKLKTLIEVVANQVDSYQGDVLAYKAEYTFRFPWSKWFTKAGKLRRIDLSNLNKVMEDCISKALNVDDRFAVDLHLRKRVNEDDDRLLVEARFELF